MQLSAATGNQSWIDTILQLSHTNEAIRHATIAIGGLGKRFQSGDVMSSRDSKSLHFDTLALSNYQKSLGMLSHTLATSNTAPAYDTLRQTLITCILFVIIDFLRGNDESLLVHLRSGSRLLQQHQDLAVGDARLHFLFLQVDMLVTLWLDRPSALSGPTPDFEMLQLAGIEHLTGGNRLEVLEGRLVMIGNRVNTVRMACKLQSLDHGSAKSQHRYVQVQLDAWVSSLNEYASETIVSGSKDNDLRTKLLWINQIYLQLILDHCFADAKSEVCQLQASKAFETILTMAKPLLQPTNLIKDVSVFWYDDSEKGRSVPLFRFSAGAICPLYLIALHASSPGIRLRALDLLERDPWREGGWDSSAMASIARRRMRGAV